MSKLRYCIDCKKDISDRPNRCIRCKECQKKADAANTRKRMKKKYVKDHPVTVNRTARHKAYDGGVRNPGTGKQAFAIQYLKCGVNKNGKFPKKKLPFPLMKYGLVWNADAEVFSYQDKESMARHEILVSGGAIWNWSETRKKEYEKKTAKYAHPSARPKPKDADYVFYTDLKDKDYIEHWEEYLKRKASNDRIQHVESQRVLRQRKKASKGKKLWTAKGLKLLKKQKKAEKQKEKKWTPKAEERRRKKEEKEDDYNPESTKCDDDDRDYEGHNDEQNDW